MKNQPIKFGDESLSDAVIIVNDQEFHVHKLVTSFIIKVKICFSILLADRNISRQCSMANSKTFV